MNTPSHAQCYLCNINTLTASRTMNPEIMAFVVAIAGIMFPAAAVVVWCVCVCVKLMTTNPAMIGLIH